MYQKINIIKEMSHRSVQNKNLNCKTKTNKKTAARSSLLIKYQQWIHQAISRPRGTFLPIRFFYILSNIQGLTELSRFNLRNTFQQMLRVYLGQTKQYLKNRQKISDIVVSNKLQSGRRH